MLGMTTSRRPRFRLTAVNDGFRVVRRESAEQVTVVQWAALAARQWPELAMLHAIPNGGKRDAAEAAHLKRQGVKPGVPDLCLPVPRGGFVGLYIELKTWPNKPTDLQSAWHRLLSDAGHRVEVCFSADAAITILQAYVSARKTVIA